MKWVSKICKSGSNERATQQHARTVCNSRPQVTQNVTQIDFKHKRGHPKAASPLIIIFYYQQLKFGVPYRVRTGVAAVKGRCPRPLDEGDFFGGARRDRTADLLHAMQALSQLSYSPAEPRHSTDLLPLCQCENQLTSIKTASVFCSTIGRSAGCMVATLWPCFKR